MLEYVEMGGNFLLAGRYGSHFFNNDLRTYCGITNFTGDLTLDTLRAADPNLVDVGSTGANSLVHFVNLDSTSEAKVIFDDNEATTYKAGFRINKDSSDDFVQTRKMLQLE